MSILPPTCRRILFGLSIANILVLFIYVSYYNETLRFGSLISNISSANHVPITPLNLSGIQTMFNNKVQTKVTKDKNALPLCPLTPPALNGPVRLLVPAQESLEEVAQQLSWLRFLEGGNKNAYRLPDDGPFNKAMIMKIGFTEALKLHDFDCFFFHDVDLIAENDRNIYSCPDEPRHLSVAIDKFDYRLPYEELFGGVIGMSRTHFQLVNGFSNMFWGWGGEDDDMYNRVRAHGLNIHRYHKDVARYHMLMHAQQYVNPKRKDDIIDIIKDIKPIRI